MILCSWPPDFLPMQEVCPLSYCIGKKTRAAISDRYARPHGAEDRAAEDRADSQPLATDTR